MPMKHRIMTLRDDVIFIIILYQGWIYRTDYSRANDFGFCFEENGEGNGEESGEIEKAEIEKVRVKALTMQAETGVGEKMLKLHKAE